MPNRPIDDQGKSQLFVFDSLAMTLLVGGRETQIQTQKQTQTNHDFSQSLTWPAGKILDKKYKIVSLLGEGGMGAVYHAHHLQLDKDIALKTFKSKDYTDEAWRLFDKEVKTLARLNDRNIIQIFDFGFTEEQIPFFTMELLHGETLAQKMEREGSLTLKSIIPYFIQLCHGLDAAHKKGILHRDIKPANIFLHAPLIARENTGSQNITVKILDFGIAALSLEEETGQLAAAQSTTSAGVCYGSPLYMSPEQATNKRVAATSDIYSLGCTIFQALSGVPPLKGETILATLLMHQNDKPQLLTEDADGDQLPKRLVQLVAKMLEKDPAKRPQSMRAVALELEEIAKLNLLKIGAGDNLEQTRASEASNFAEMAGQYLQPKYIAAASLVLVSMIGLTSWFAYSANERARQVTKSTSSVFSEAPDKVIIHTTRKSLDTDTPVLAKYLINDPATARAGFKHFKFPSKHSLGIIKYGPYSSEVRLSIVGDQYVPTNALLHFEAKRIMAEQPEYFDGFGPDDFDAVRLENLSSSEMMSDLNWSDKQFSKICTLTGMTKLAFADFALTAKSLADFNKLNHLTELTMWDQKADLSWLAGYHRLTKLTSLRISQAENIAPILNKLRDGNNLKVLAISDCNLTRSDLETVSEFKTISALDISCNKIVDDKTIELFAKLPRLDSLNLCHTSITPAIIHKLSLLKALHVLTVSGNLLSLQQRQYVNSIKPRSIILMFED